MSSTLALELFIGCCSFFIIFTADNESMCLALLQGLYALMVVMQHLLVHKSTFRFTMGLLTILKFTGMAGLMFGGIITVAEAKASYNEYTHGNRLVLK